MSSQGQSSSPLPSSRASTPASSGSEIPKSWPCSCGRGDGTGKYIECDNPDCRVGWYHWKCVQVTEEPAGTWLCPSCSPNAAFYIKQLVKTRATPPLGPKSGTAATPTSSKGKERESENKNQKSAKKGIAVKKQAPEKPKPKRRGWVEIPSDEEDTELTPKPGKAATPTSSRMKEHEPLTNDNNVAKKGVAVKKTAPEKPKPKWPGWIELPSDDEEEYKKMVDAKWTKGVVEGKRRRASEANETASRRLRARSKAANKTRKVVDTDSEEGEETDTDGSVYQQQEEEEEEEEEAEASVPEPSVDEEPSLDKELSDDQEDFEETMDADEEIDHADEESWSGLSDSPSNSESERHVSPDLAQKNVISGRNDEGSASEAEAEDVESSMDMDSSQDESVEASSGNLSDISEYVDDDDASASSQAPTNTLNGREAADSSSLSPEATPVMSPASPSTASPQDQFPASDDSMDIDEESEAQNYQDQVFATVYPAVESNNDAALYPQRVNYSGYFRESAIRSTLPRLA